MNSFIIVFAVLAATASASPSGWGGYGGWNGGHGAGGVYFAGGYGGGHYDGGWDDSHGPYSNVVAGNGAVSVGAAGPIVNDLGHGHGVAVVGPATAPVKIIGPGATGKIVAEGLWGPTHAHGHGGHGGHW